MSTGVIWQCCLARCDNCCSFWLCGTECSRRQTTVSQSERMSLAMSLIYSKNNKGPRTVPWGTPEVTVHQDDWVPFSEGDTKERIQPITRFRHVCHMSKVLPRGVYEERNQKLLRSWKLQCQFWYQESKLLAQSSIAKTSCVSQEWPALNRVGEVIESYLIPEID